MTKIAKLHYNHYETLKQNIAIMEHNMRLKPLNQQQHEFYISKVNQLAQFKTSEFLNER